MRLTHPDWFDIPRLADWHVHLRQGVLCEKVVPWTARYCDHALVMPNTVPPVARPADLDPYRKFVLGSVPEGSACTFHFAFMLTPSTTPGEVADFKDAGAGGAKLYPEGVTTHSNGGIPGAWLGRWSMDRNARPPLRSADEDFLLCLSLLEKGDMIFHVHPEMPGSFVLNSEADFIPFLDRVRSVFPRLRLQVEHVTSAAMVSWVQSQPLDRVCATLTPQHLAYDLGALFEGGLRPWRYCKPVYKLPSDNAALWEAAQDEHFFLGSDSAPHAAEKKLASCGCAGVWSAPVLPQVLFHLFEARDLAGLLPEFVRFRADRFHLGEASRPETLRLYRRPWRVPDLIEGMEPLMAGETLNWSLQSGDTP